MGLAKRLDMMVLEERITESEADEILEAREALWTGREKNGQGLLGFGSSTQDDDCPF